VVVVVVVEANTPPRETGAALRLMSS
jgi:hypothetical protein